MIFKRSRARIVFEIFNYAVMLSIWVLMLYPFLYVLASSFSSNASVLAGRVGIFPDGFNLRAYEAVFKYRMVWISYRNTILYTVVGTAVNLFMTISGAYPLSRRDFYGRRFFTVMIAITMFFGGGLIPSFLLVRNLGMYDKMWAIILPGAISTTNMIIMRTFFQNIPEALEEAAIIDGANDIRVLTSIILPLSTASIMTIGMFYAVGHWNSWFPAMIYLRDRMKHPLQLVLRQIVLQNQVNELLSQQSGTTIEDATNLIGETVKYATIIVTIAPIIMVYPFVQKHFVRGVMIGSIKG